MLVLEPPAADPRQKIGGLPLALRLALDAQRAGAHAVVVTDGAASARAVLGDRRLHIPVLDRLPDGPPSVHASASLLTHRGQFAALDGDGTPASARVDESTPPPAVAYAFAPIEVRDRASARRAERLLFRSLRKPQDGWTSRWLNRYISLAISRWLVRTPLHPNHVSPAILAVGLFGAYLAAQGSYTSLLLGALLFQTQSVLDGCDGEMSRVTHRGSLAGQWLDTIGDDLTNYSFFGAAAWGLFQTTGHPAYLGAGIVTVGSGIVASGIEYRYLIRIGSGDLLKYPIQKSDGGSGGVLSAIQPLFKRDTFVLLTLVAALFGWIGPMLFVFSAGAVGVLANVIAAELRMHRERRRAGADPMVGEGG